MTADQVLALAPDAASAKAAHGLSAPRAWVAAGVDGALLWGECKGSGATPYQTRVDLTTVAYKCSCPSRKFPCKHVLGLLLLHAANGAAQAAAPEWASTWLAERDAKAQRAAETAAKPRTPADPAAGEAAAAKRAKAREGRVAAGIDECALWLRDVVRLGLAHAQTQPSRYWEERAARLVDAQCAGLARRVRALASTVASGAGWESRLLDSLGEIALLCTAYGRLDALPDALRADVRRHVGWTQTQEEIIARAFDVVDDRWLVVGTRSEEEERLTVRRTWLRGERTRRDALLLQFAPVGAPVPDPLVAGARLDARLVFVESAAPLRAVFAERGAFEAASAPPDAAPLDEALGAYARAVGGDPWLERFPFVLRDVTPVHTADGRWYVRDARDRALPLARTLREPFVLHACAGGHPVTVAGEWDGRALLPLGLWSGARYTALV
ncbi:MAG: SWIM zinc finger family protein [Candidatus Eremiobacteraeota bacterium]|nr:SWIM zinc finger family protein [Candidatus Eremiobacteraeota bacterium]MBV9409150.1 SWIM zinc finger family protein [Candidatus Eremiobacteraeota bacterium]